MKKAKIIKNGNVNLENIQSFPYNLNLPLTYGKEIYIVEGSRGSYDDWNWFIIGIYSNKKDAEKCKDEFIKNIKNIIQTVKCPVSPEIAKRLDEFDVEGIENWENLYEKYTYYKHLLVGDWKVINLDTIEVKEYPMEKLIFDFPKTPIENLNAGNNHGYLKEKGWDKNDFL